MLKLVQLLQDIRHALWFIPSIIISAAVLLAMFAVEADTRVGSDALSNWPRLFGASAEGARSMLHVIANAMISAGTLTFSITMLVLSSAAAQYTPQVIRTFMSSKPTQVVLGVFLGIFVYCLVVLRTIRGGPEAFVPSLAITIAILLSLIGVAVLVYFIHHIASSIQASTIVCTIADSTIRTIDATFTDELSGTPDEPRQDGADAGERWFAVNAVRTGYLRTIDMKALAAYADKHALTVQLVRNNGDFVVEGSPLVLLNAAPKPQAATELNRIYAFGQFRTVDQDVSVGIQQLVDIALKAMSPAVNDTSTALLCLDYLSAVLVRLANRTLAPKIKHRDGKPVVLQHTPGFGDYLSAAFEPIRLNARDNISIYVRLMQSLGRIVQCTEDAARRKLIIGQIDMVWDYAQQALQRPDQLAAVSQSMSAALKALNQRTA